MTAPIPPKRMVKRAIPRMPKRVEPTTTMTPKRKPRMMNAIKVKGTVIGKNATYIRDQKITSPCS